MINNPPPKKQKGKPSISESQRGRNKRVSARTGEMLPNRHTQNRPSAFAPPASPLKIPGIGKGGNKFPKFAALGTLGTVGSALFFLT